MKDPESFERPEARLSPDYAEKVEGIMSRIQSGDRDTIAAVGDELRKVTVPKTSASGAGPDWIVVRVELLSGMGQVFEPPPGRDVLVSPQHTFRQLAETINASFGRWDLSHLYAFRLEDGRVIGTRFEDLDFLEAARTKLGGRWREGDTFRYEFDFGDSWEHRCSVLQTHVDPEDMYGMRPKGPVAIFGWGTLPDQYGRRSPTD